MTAERRTFAPEAGMYRGEALKQPPHFCLEIRNPRWRKLLRRAEEAKPIAEGDRIRLVDSGLEYIAGKPERPAPGVINVPLTPAQRT